MKYRFVSWEDEGIEKEANRKRRNWRSTRNMMEKKGIRRKNNVDNRLIQIVVLLCRKRFNSRNVSSC
jgi:hypothetical protein